jgi:tetratricopeptide (TPR) repeat protein
MTTTSTVEPYRNWAIALLLAVTVTAVFWRAGQYEFTNCDDPEYVTANPIVQSGITSEGVRWAFTNGSAGMWHPLTWLSHMLDCQLFGLNPAAHHRVNVVWHVLNTLLLFFVLRRLTGAQEASAVVAALFALHPLRVESVAWVAERKGLLSASFWMLTLWAYARYTERRSWTRYGATFLCFLGGVMAKPVVVTLPFVLLLLDYWPLNRLRLSAAAPGTQASSSDGAAAGGSSGSVSLGEAVVEKLPFLVVSVVVSVATFFASQAIAGALSELPVSARLSNAVVSYARYLAKTVVPIDLAVLYPHPGTWGGPVVFASLFLLGVISLGVLLFLRSRPYLVVGWLWFLGTLVPVIGLVQAGPQAMADRFTYLPHIGLFIACVWGLADLSRELPRRRLVLTSATALALAACLVLSLVQLPYWRSSLTLFSHALGVTQNNVIAHYNLAQALSLQAQALADRGRTTEAAAVWRASLPHYQEALRLQPRYASAESNLGLTLARLGDPAAATNHYLAALRLEPRNEAFHFNLALALASLGQWPAAVEQFRSVLALAPDHAVARFQLALALTTLNRHAEAVREYRELLRLSPNEPEVLNNLAWILAAHPSADLRNGAEAVKLAGRACELTARRQPVFLGTLAAAQAEVGEFEKASETARQACQVARSLGQTNLVQVNEQFLKLYQEHRPARITP